MRGQVAIEYMVILIISITLLIATFYISLGSFSERSETFSLTQAQISANDISSAVNFLCSKPEDATIMLYVRIPSLVSMQNSSIGNRSIIFKIITSSSERIAYANTDCAVNGTLPSVTGGYKFKIQRTLTNVNVTHLTSR